MASTQTLTASGPMPGRSTMHPAQKLHYTPLAGTTLKQLAVEKRHHGPGGRFVNPLGSLHRRDFWQVIRWKVFSKNRFRSALAQQPVHPVDIDWAAVDRHNGLSITFIKHATVMIKDAGTYLLVDPVFSKLFWFIRDFSPLRFEPADMPQPDHVLITHGHYDHLNTPTLRKLDNRTHLITPLGYERIFSKLGMPHRTRLDWFQSYTDGRRRITLLPCNHWTMRNPLAGPNHSLWGSYLIETAAGKTIYLSGDTAWFDGFAELGRMYRIDLALFNLGAYEPRWFMAPSHMNPVETIKAFKQLGADQLIIVHWGTYRLGDEPVHYPPLDLKQALAREGLQDSLLDLKHGDTHFSA